MKITIAVTALTIIASVWGQYYGEQSATKRMELSAIESGVGEYFIDLNNEKSFRWKQTK